MVEDGVCVGGNEYGGHHYLLGMTIYHSLECFGCKSEINRRPEEVME